MKKNILYFFGVLLVAILSIGFVSCGDDNDDENNAQGGDNTSTLLVGTWSRNVTGSCTGSEAWTFNKNGTGTFVMNTTCNKASEPFTYNIITWDSSSRIGYIRIVYTNENRKVDMDFTLNGNTIFIAGDTYKK